MPRRHRRATWLSLANVQVRAVRAVLILVLASCGADAPSREQRILEALADDNLVAGRREPALVAMKLRKMQRGPYEWLRGTASLYWRDLMEPGATRASTTFGDAKSSRVLLVGDPHPENVGTFRGFSDGQMFLDWNDFDATGYGPLTGDVRRLAAGFVVIATLGEADPDLTAELTTLVATGYAEQIASIAAGVRPAALGAGHAELFDDELAKAQSRGDTLFAVNEFAPVEGEIRTLALGDLEAVADDGVLEDRVIGVDAEQADWIDRAIAQWAPGRLTPAEATIKLRARRIGAGVSSYPVFRFQAVLEGSTSTPEDDRIVEIKETREGVIMRGLPILQGAEWDTPAERAVDTQLRLHARFDGDRLLGAAQVGGLSFKIRDREAYQRGINFDDLAELVIDDPAQLRVIAKLYGALLARAHAQALTADRILGADVIAPLLAGRESAFVDEIAALAAGDAAQVIADHALMKDQDLATLLDLGRPQ